MRRDRKTITIDADLYDDLATRKDATESWSDLLARLADECDADAEHSVNTLTEAHIDDIAATTARRTLEELETARR